MTGVPIVVAIFEDPNIIGSRQKISCTDTEISNVLKVRNKCVGGAAASTK